MCLCLSKLYFHCQSSRFILIGLLCIIYLILFHFLQLSFENLFSQTWIQLNIHPNISKTNNSFICDRQRNDHGKQQINISLSTDEYFSKILRPYCDIVPTPRQKWIPAKDYIESDIVFLIYTASTFYHTRATAVRDTWLSHVTHKYFFSATPYPSLPITVIDNAGEDYLSNIKKIYYGMQIAYREHNQSAKFYFLAGCDTFVNIPYLLKRLDQFDYQQPLLIGGYKYVQRCYLKRNVTPGAIFYPSGGAGLVFTGQMMQLMQPKLNSYFENDWPLTEDKAFSDIALSCLAKTMGIDPTFVSGFWPHNPKIHKFPDKKQLHTDLEPNTFHYIDPLSMYALDEFYIHQLLDRLENDQNFDELVKFIRQFVIAHYYLLRIKRQECTLPKIIPVEK